jgi:FkbM family methyltransferase
MRHWLDPLRPSGARLSLEGLRRLPRFILLDLIRARARAVPLDDGVLLCRALGRYKLLVDGRDRGLAPHLLLDGWWEIYSTHFLLNRLRRGQVAWDVGANIGYFTLLMADRVGPAGQVIAVEPHPRLAALCRRSVELNGFAARTRIEQAAASDRAGMLRLRDNTADPKNNHVIAEGAPPDPVLKEIAVPATPLDDLGDRADFLKIDVEGAEEAVWSGMQRLLARNPEVTLLMEFNALRCADPAALLRDIAGRFPLRELADRAKAIPADPAALLSRERDTMLVLTRGAIA